MPCFGSLINYLFSQLTSPHSLVMQNERSTLGWKELKDHRNLPVGIWTHVAVVLDGQRGVLYTNGVPVATNATLNLLPSDLNVTNNWFGRSNWPDPYFNGRLSSVRLFARALSATEIVGPQVVIAGLTSDGSSFVQIIQSENPFPIGVWTHVAIALDGRQGIFS